MSDLLKPASEPPPNPDWLDELLERMKAEASAPNGKSSYDWSKFTPYILAAWVSINGLGAWVGSSYIEKQAKTDQTANDAYSKAVTIERERLSRAPAVDARISAVETITRVVPLMAQEVAGLKEAQRATENTLNEGRKERVLNDKELVSALNNLDKRLSLVQQMVEASNRKTLPFLQNQKWTDLTLLFRKVMLSHDETAGRSERGG